MNVGITHVIQIVFAFQCVFGSALLARQPRFRFLVYLLAGNALLMLFNLLEETGVTRDIHQITPAFSLLWGPLLLLLVQSLVDERALSKRDALHFLPPLLALIFSNAVQPVLLFGAASQVLYGTAVVLLIRHYHIACKALSSNASDTGLAWLTKVLCGFALLAVLDITRHSLQPVLREDAALAWYSGMLTAHLVLFSYVIFRAVTQPETFACLQQYRSLTQSSPIIAQCADQSLATIFAHIDQQVRSGHLYQRERFSLRDLAAATGLQERDVSQAINRVGQKNFNDYINSLRVEHVKRALGQADSPAILDLALAAGFSSKSSFNATFKRLTGQTPSQYLAVSRKS